MCCRSTWPEWEHPDATLDMTIRVYGRNRTERLLSAAERIQTQLHQPHADLETIGCHSSRSTAEPSLGPKRIHIGIAQKKAQPHAPPLQIAQIFLVLPTHLQTNSVLTNGDCLLGSQTLAQSVAVQI